MEALNQAYGYILYRTQIAEPVSGELRFDTLHDYAQVYIDGKLAGTVDRRLGQYELPLNITAQHARLDILVERSDGYF